MALIAICISCYAQNVIDVKYSDEKEGQYSFTCVNNGYCDYYVSLDFPVLTGFNYSTSVPVRTTIRRGSQSMTTLTMNNTAPPQFQYTYNYLKGAPISKLNPDFPYLLPFKPGNSSEVFELQNVKDWVNKTKSSDLYALGFKMNEGDTIFAIRRGKVCEINDQVLEKASNYIMKDDNNSIEIYQEDGTIAQYEIFKKNSIFVKLDDQVEAGDPIGIVGGKEYSMGSHLRLMIYYLDRKKLGTGEIVAGQEYYSYFKPQFVTQNEGRLVLKHGSKYTSAHPESIIIQEMSKKEIAKRSKRKGVASN
jgi:hypothetical protein